ncbi:hypothetical protein E4U55_006531 [Claviceps digitariae]|nr:hypothetical protein E4U55_006531 [Claviceps digitariae]
MSCKKRSKPDPVFPHDSFHDPSHPYPLGRTRLCDKCLELARLGKDERAGYTQASPLATHFDPAWSIIVAPQKTDRFLALLSDNLAAPIDAGILGEQLAAP